MCRGREQILSECLWQQVSWTVMSILSFYFLLFKGENTKSDDRLSVEEKEYAADGKNGQGKDKEK